MALMATLRSETEDPVWLFMDANQNIYEQELEMPGGFLSFDLTWNCRNTKAIHREVAKLYKGAVTPEVIGPEGRALELHVVADPVKTVASVVERLVAEEGVRQGDVVILSSHALAKSAFASGRLGPYRLVEQRGKDTGILYSSIRAFKGLESPVVVLCEVEDLGDLSRSQQLYVALSRARNHVVIVVPEPSSA
jgi:hypothetical protein